MVALALLASYAIVVGGGSVADKADITPLSCDDHPVRAHVERAREILSNAYAAKRWRVETREALSGTRKQRWRRQRDCVLDPNRRANLRQAHENWRQRHAEHRAAKLKARRQAWRSITVKGVRADRHQRRVTRRTQEVGFDFDAGNRGLVSSQMTITQECSARNCLGGDRDSRGPYQQRTSWPGDPRDIENAATNFFVRSPTYAGGALGYARDHPNATPGQIAQAIQRSAFPHAYSQWREEAERTVRRYRRWRAVRP